jgi:hypothetical protein
VRLAHLLTALRKFQSCAIFRQKIEQSVLGFSSAASDWSSTYSHRLQVASRYEALKPDLSPPPYHPCKMLFAFCVGCPRTSSCIPGIFLPPDALVVAAGAVAIPTVLLGGGTLLLFSPVLLGIAAITSPIWVPIGGILLITPPILGALAVAAIAFGVFVYWIWNFIR